MTYAQIISNRPVALNPALAVSFERDGQTINASYQTVMLWSDQERAAIGVYPIVDDAIPDGKVATGSTLENDAGVIRRRWQLTPIPAPTEYELLERAALARWAKETGGIEVNGLSIPTDERTRGVLDGAYTSATEDQDFIVDDWKISPGVYVTLDNATVKAIALAVRDHVKACFSINRRVDEKIISGEITTLEQVNAEFA